MSGSKLRNAYIIQAEKACAGGATIKDLAERFGVTAKTIYGWRGRCSEFKAAIDAGRDVYHLTVAENSLMKRLEGYFYNEIYSVPSVRGSGKAVVTKIVKRHVPPDPGSLRFYLRNRNKERWPDNQDVNVNLIKNLSDEELDKQIHLIVDNTRKKKDATG